MTAVKPGQWMSRSETFSESIEGDHLPLKLVAKGTENMPQPSGSKSSLGNWLKSLSPRFLIVAFVLCLIGFHCRDSRLGVESLDRRLEYSVNDVEKFMKDIEENRTFYAVTELTLDIIFPVVYGSLFWMALIHLGARRRSLLLLVPVLAVLFDFAENILVSYLALTFPQNPDNLPPLFPKLAKAASACTSTKWVCIYASLLMVSVLALKRCGEKFFGENKDSTSEGSSANPE